MFSQDQLHKIIQETLPNTLPGNRTNAVVGLVDEKGVSLVAKFTLRERWELEAVYKRDWLGKQDLGAKVIYSW